MDEKAMAEKFLLAWERWTIDAVEALREDISIYTTLRIGPCAAARQELLETLRELRPQFLIEREGKTHE